MIYYILIIIIYRIRPGEHSYTYYDAEHYYENTIVVVVTTSW